MATATPAHKELALWLLAYEQPQIEEPEALAEAAERTCQKLGQRLARLVTLAGFQALLARALRIARADFPFLDGVRPGSLPDACLEGLRERVLATEAAQAREAIVTVLATTFGLLGSFIGDELTLRLVRDIWPDARLGEAGSHTREDHA